MPINPVMLLNQMQPCYRDPTTLEGVQTANFANSTVPASATLSNTAAGYTTLGGQWKFAAVAGAETDYALFAYQVPALWRLWLNGIAISALIMGAANAATETLLEWGLGVNSTAVSLATSDSSPAFGPRRISLGAQYFATTAAIGTTTVGPDLVRAFANPIRVEPGRFLHVILRIPVATATTSELIRGDCAIDGYFESTASNL